MRKETERFLEETGMHYESVDMRACTARFVEEMRRGLRGEASSLMMLPTYLRVGDAVPLGKEIAVMDAGGTNFRVATVKFDETGPQIANFNKFPMPGTQGRIGREEFFDAMAERLLPVAETSEQVGFCFSYPTDIRPNRDGAMICFTKEVLVDRVEGELIGEGINRALNKRGVAPKTFVLLNDTVATLLGGVAATQGEAYESHIGYILGTGSNTCYLERCENIVKSSAACALQGAMAVNLESGGFAALEQGLADKDVDSATATPGKMVMEKMTSGHYQGTVIYHTVRRAVEKDIFSREFAEKFSGVRDFSMYEIDQFCFHPHGKNPLALLCRCEQDAVALYELVDASFERAARLAAVNIAAILLQTDAGANPTRPVCVTAEGTTFYKSKLFYGKLGYYTRSFLQDELGRYLEFLRVENATLIGAAVAALLN